jgi:hypothetical protein
MELGIRPVAVVMKKADNAALHLSHDEMSISRA